MGRRQRSPIARGLSLLNGSDTLGWWDMHAAAAVTAVTTSTTSNVASWAKSAGITITSGIADPDGGTAAYRVSIAATGSQYIRGPSLANRYSGFSRTTMKIKVAEFSSMTSIFWQQHAYALSRLNVLRAAADETATQAENSCHVAANTPNLGCQWSDIGDGWRYAELDEISPHVSAAVCRYQPSLTATAPDVAARDLFDVYQVTCVQQRVSAVADRNGGTALAQATNDARHTVIPGGWLGRDCAVGVGTGGSSSTAARAVGAGPWAVFGTLQPILPEFAGTDPVVTMTGAACAASLTIAGGTAVARGTYGWSWTTDAGVTTTGTFGGILAAVPVAVALVYTGSVLRLYIDGVQVGTDQAVAGVATITGVNVTGQAAQVAWAAWAVRQGAHSAAHARDVSLALRSYAALPAYWRGVLKSGQSNSTDTQPPEDRANVGRRLVLGQALSRRGLDALYALSYAPWYPATSAYWHLYGDKRQLWGGTGQAFALAAVAAADYGYCVLDMGKGGEAIAAWQAGGTLRTHTEAQFPLGVADFGTNLIRWEDIIWIQGESDTVAPAGYRTKLADVMAWARNLIGNPSARVILQRLNSNNTSSTPENVAALIAEQVAWAAADGNADVAEADFAAPQYDGVHYARRGVAVMGTNTYRAHVGLAPLAA